MADNEFEIIVNKSKEISLLWRALPAPQRGEFIRKFGEELRQQKESLAQTITKEARKIETESLGEVQEAIDMCDFAVGLSRQLYGLTMPSERPNHRLQELWHPLGIVGCITAFNFPMAVFAWNFCLAAVCGNSIIWKPSPHSNECARGIKKAWDKVSGDFSDLILILEGGNEEAVSICKDNRIALVSATGSTQMGKELAPIVSARLGKLLLELGGNNAAIVCPSADLDLTIKGIAFSACGTSGQRCTSLRRLFVHEDIYEPFMEMVKKRVSVLNCGDPFDLNTQVGAQASNEQFEKIMSYLDIGKQEGAEVLFGGEKREMNGNFSGGYYVEPTAFKGNNSMRIFQEEIFGPVVSVATFKDEAEAVSIANDTLYGLGAGVWSRDANICYRMGRAIEAGRVWVNCYHSYPAHAAFGGYKNSGIGRETHKMMLNHYQQTKNVLVSYAESPDGFF